MEIIPLMLIAVIILLSSFPAPIKAPGRSSGGGSIPASANIPGNLFGGGRTPVGTVGGYRGGEGGAIGSGYRGGDSGGGDKPPGGAYDGHGMDAGKVGTGYRGGQGFGKPGGGGDPGASIVVFPKNPKDTPKKVMPMPQQCKQEVRNCINDHIYGGAGAPKYHGYCCTTLKHAVPCVCKFLSSQDPKLIKGANDVLQGCHFRKPKCRAIPMPQECGHEVEHCIDTHLYGGAGQPQYRGACCKKFKHSKKCVCKFLTSKDSHLTKQANGVVRGCHFTKPNCPKT